MKTKKVLSGLLYNVIVASVISAVTGFSFMAVAIGGVMLSVLIPSMSGVLPMAVQKEIWMSTIVEGLFADNSFLSKAINADEFVNDGKKVHIPNAGAASGVVKNRSSFPANIEVRNDVDLDFTLDEFTTDPIRIPHADTVELSYNKRESVIRTDRAKLQEEVSVAILHSWLPAQSFTIKTTGDAVTAHTASATGNRKAFTKADVKTAFDKFNLQDIPQEGRYMLVDAVMYGQLIDSLTDKEATAFHALADVANGIVGKLYGFNIMMRSKAGLYTGAVVKKAWSTAGSATDKAAALAWHENSVCRALGDVKMFSNEDDPTYYGDIYSFLVRGGGRAMRNGSEGLLAIVQDSAE